MSTERAIAPLSSAPAPRHRAVLLGVLAVVVASGLLSRRYPLPGLLAEHVGDALYTVAVFVALALFQPAARARWLGLAAWLVSAAVESSQVLQWKWLIEVRATRLGTLLLGQGWQWADLLAYAVGATVAFAVDAGLRRARTAAT